MASASSSQEMTPAQRMMAQHAAAESHQPTVEDVIDEEDIAHPPPSLQPSSAPEPASVPKTNGAAPSSKATGKQRATEEPLAETINGTKYSPQGKAPFDTQSEAAFPSLAAPKTSIPNSAASMWGRKPASINNGAGVGFNNVSSNTTSRSSAPASVVKIPGQCTDKVELSINQLKPRADLKKPIPELVRDANRRSQAKIEMTTSAGHVTFHGRGPNTECVHQALKDLLAQVGAKQMIKVPIPASARSHIIGRQGSTIQQISKRSGAKVQVPRPGDARVDIDDDDAIINVEIEGDSITAALAKKEIEAIVGQRPSTVNSKMRHIPAEFYPFIAGAHNSRLNALQEGREVQVHLPQYHAWHRQPPEPVSSPGESLNFTPQEGLPIQLSGDRDIVRQVQSDIEVQVARLQRTLTLHQIEVERARHQFVVGERGSSLHDFLEETGCSVILPPSSHDTETVTIVGPPDQIENAVNKILDLASSMTSTSVDLTRIYGSNSPGTQTHARDVTRYLQERQALRELENLHNANIVTSNSPGSISPWQIYAREGKNAMRARADVTNLLGAHPPSRFRNVDIHPFYQQELRSQHAEAVRDKHGVHLVFPDNELVQTPVLLVYEGSEAFQDYAVPRSMPSNDQIPKFEHALAEVERYILALADAQEEIVQQSLEAPLKYREKVQKYIRREMDRAAEQPHPLQFLDYDGPASNSSADASSRYAIKFRGPSALVNEQKVGLLAFIEQQVQEEKERGYTASCDFPQRFTNVLIGRKGENINKLRDDFDVELQVQDGKVEIKGPQAKANAARAHIIALSKKLEDETTHIVKIKSQFHGELIGSKGSQVTRLQDKCKVRITFPRSALSPSDGQSLADGVGETEALSKPKRSTQAPDEIYIRGPKKGADEAREELLSLYQYLQDNSNTTSVSIAQSQIPSLVGAGGRELDNLRLTTGAAIDVPRSKGVVSPSGRVEVSIKGNKSQCEAAKKLLSKRAKAFDATVSRTMDVDQKHHRALVGPGGENIHRMIAEAGGPTGDRERARIAHIPRLNSGDSVIRLEGSEDVIERLQASIQAFVDQRDSQITEVVVIPPERHGALIGRGGETRKGLEKEFRISLSVPSTSVTGPERSNIRITGLPEDVEKAKARILATVKDQEGETIDVAICHYYAIADSSGGNFFQNLKRHHNVTVDHAGQQKPTRTKVQAPANSGTASAALPLITDADVDTSTLDADEHHTWHIVNASTVTDNLDSTIPFVLKAPDSDKLAEAKRQLEEAIAAAQVSRTGFLGLPDPRMHRHVIGAGGSTINSIRKETGCKIDVPKSKTAGGPIEITGDEQALEQARQLILEAVARGGR
ncbi:MAG: hypothetical protein M1828_007455 [Chrysothrix sp. TS-e1954]|nr:MAG: hypothetical protein M1828_007455 [Chrysothrix sp. TS-e1954]